MGQTVRIWDKSRRQAFIASSFRMRVPACRTSLIPVIREKHDIVYRNPLERSSYLWGSPQLPTLFLCFQRKETGNRLLPSKWFSQEVMDSSGLVFSLADLLEAMVRFCFRSNFIFGGRFDYGY